MQARIHITLKPEVLDPQGKAVLHALGGLGFGGIEDVRQGKTIDITLAETDRSVAEQDLIRMCETLLTNTVIENYEIEIDGI